MCCYGDLRFNVSSSQSIAKKLEAEETELVLELLSLLCINYLILTHAYMHRDKVRHAAQLSPLSQVFPWWATIVQSLQTPCQRAPQAGDQAAWRQGPEALLHSASHSGAAHRLDH